jgi:hypothetical protein
MYETLLLLEAEKTIPLTVNILKRHTRQLRQREGDEHDHLSRQLGHTAVSGGTLQRGEPNGEPQSATEPTTTQQRDEGTDSEDLDVYTSRTERQVRLFLDNLKDEDFTHGPAPIPDVIEDGIVEELRQQKECLKALSLEELRALVLDLYTELVFTLYDAVTLETNLTETDEDAAVLERAVDERDERIELMRVQLNTVEDENVDLHDAKREALRKLSEAKTEMALLCQRNAKLLKQLDLKDEEIQMSLTTSLSGSQRASLVPVERRDVSTWTDAAMTRKDGHELSVSGAAACTVDAPLSLSGRSKSIEGQRELEGVQEELRLARQTLYGTEMERIKLQEQLQELKEATMQTFRSSSSRSDYEEKRKDEEHAAALKAMEERCEKSEKHAGELEETLRQLREELQVVKKTAHEERRRKEEAEAALRAATASAVAAEELRETRVALSSGAGTPADSSSLARAADDSRGSSTEPGADTVAGAIAAARLSLSQPRSVSMEAQVAVLQRQLARAQADATHFEQELRKEREKTQRQTQSEKRLLENVTSLTRQLRTREALEREARLLRRSEMNTARCDGGEGGNGGDDGGTRASISEPRHSRFTVDRSSRGAATTGEDSRGAANERSQRRYATPELSQRRESIFAALRSIQKVTEERRQGTQPGVNELPIASSNHDAPNVPDVKPAATPPRGTPKPLSPPLPEPQPAVPLESKEEPKLMLAKSKGTALTPPTTATASTTTPGAAAGPTPALSAENPSTSVSSSYRAGRLSVTSLISPRGPPSGSFGSFTRDTNADSVRVDAAPHNTSSTAAAASTDVEAADSATTASTPPPPPPRHGFMRGPVSALRTEGLLPTRKMDSASKPAAPGNKSSLLAEPTPYALSEMLNTQPPSQAQSPPPHHVSRGQSCVRGSTSAHPAAICSSSVGADAHRSSLSISVPSITTATGATGASASDVATSGSSAVTALSTPRGATIVRGQATTTTASAAGNGPVAAPRKRTASRRIVTGREAKTTSTREGSTAVLR